MPGADRPDITQSGRQQSAGLVMPACRIRVIALRVYRLVIAVAERAVLTRWRFSREVLGVPFVFLAF
jgi:hypothetical protein